MKNSFIYTVIFTFILCFIFVIVLSFVYESTKDIIAMNKKFVQEKAILNTLGINVETKEDIMSEFKKVTQEQKDGIIFYKGDSQESSIVKQFSGPGLWGVIVGYIALSKDLTRVTGFEVIDQNETPGLGARISEPWFKEQLKGEKILNNTIKVGPGGVGDTDKNNGIIDGITGATRTSDGIQQILINEIKIFKKTLGR